MERKGEKQEGTFKLHHLLSEDAGKDISQVFRVLASIEMLMGLLLFLCTGMPFTFSS